MRFRFLAFIMFPLLLMLVVSLSSCSHENTDCVPECDTRECGPDPKYGVSCGECSTGEICEIGGCSEPDCWIDASASRSTDPDWKLDPTKEPVEGFICPKRDVDYYWFETTENGTTLEVELFNKVTMSPVELCYAVLTQQEEEPPIGSMCDHEGLDGITEIYGNHYLPEAGIYFLMIDDEDRDDEDRRNRYYLSIGLSVE